jgi:hypothetical protein
VSVRDLLAYVLILLSCVNKAAKPTGLASTIKTVSLFGSKYAIIRCAVSSLFNFSNDLCCSVEFYGHIFGAQGISPDPKRVAAIKNAPVPKDVTF